MKCMKCDTQNPGNARFCLQCGSKLGVDAGVSCPGCGGDVQSGAKFCPSCGLPVGGAELDGGTQPPREPAGASGHLAGSLERLAPKQYVEHLLASKGRVAGERRVVTILFSDVKGSTEMAENLDPEDLMEIMNGAFEVLIEPIYRYEGTLARLMGDAILCFFGAPIAHEDDAARACHAALEITARARDYAQKLERDRGITGFDVRVGINTGLVVVGEVGTDLRVEYTAMGDAVNLAKRMESAADPGTVLIAGDTHKMIAGLFETADLGWMSVKGKAEPVRTFRVLRARSKPEPVRRKKDGRTSVVGRDRELALLGGAIETLSKGAGGAFAVVGEAGVGKSRLIAETCRSRPKSVTWIEGRCMPYARDMSYWIARDLLCSLAGMSSDADPTAKGAALKKSLKLLLPKGGGQAPSNGPPEGEYEFLARLMDIPPAGQGADKQYVMEPEVLRQGMLRAFRDFIELSSRSKPLVLVWDDLQWIDPSSLDLLEALVQLTGQAPLLLLLVFRLEDGRICDFHERMRKSHGDCYRIIDVAPLGREESARLLDTLLSGSSLPGRTFDLLLDSSDGNPFFLEEVVGAIHDSHLLDPNMDKTITASKIKALGIPTTLHGAIMSRLDRLQPQERSILQAASVVGRVFQRRVIARVLEKEIPEDKLDELLGLLCRGGFLQERRPEKEAKRALYGLELLKDVSLWKTMPLKIPKQVLDECSDTAPSSETGYYFKNAVIFEVMYNSQLKSQRGDLHRRVGETIEEMHPDRLDELAPMLAYHYERGKMPDKAFTYLVSTARRAVRINAVREAVASYRRALDVAAKSGEIKTEAPVGNAMDTAAVHEELGDVLYAMSEYREAMEEYEAVLEITENPVRRAALKRKKGQVSERWAKYDDARRFFEEGLEELSGHQDKTEAAYIYAGLGLVHYHLDELDRAVTLGTKAMEIMEDAGNDRGIAQACNNLGIMFYKRDDLDRAVGLFRRCLSLWEGIGESYGLASCCNNLGLVLQRRGDWEGAVEHFEKSLELFEKLGNQHGIARACDNLGRIYMEHDQIDKAVECTKKAFTILTEISKDESELGPELWQSGMW